MHLDPVTKRELEEKRRKHLEYQVGDGYHCSMLRDVGRCRGVSLLPLL